LHRRIHGQWRQPDYWHWCYLEGPAGSGTVAAIKDGHLIGKMGNVYSRLSVNGRSVKAGLLEGLEVVPEERTWQCFRGILASCVEASRDDRVSFGYAFSTKSSARMNQKIGWSILGRVPMYAAFVDVQQALTDRSLPFPLPWLGRFLEPAIKISLKEVGDQFEAYEFKPVERFDSCFDEIWSSVKESRTVAVVKDARYLNWRYRGCPDRKHECWAVYQKGLLQGWVVFRTRRRHREGCLLELVARNDDPQVLRRLVQWTLQRFVANRVGLVRASFPLTSPEGTLLGDMGFHKWTTFIAGIELVVASASEKNGIAPPELRMENWHFSLGDWLYY
jgi:hypothetical protein